MGFAHRLKLLVAGNCAVLGYEWKQRLGLSPFDASMKSFLLVSMGCARFISMGFCHQPEHASQWLLLLFASESLISGVWCRHLQMSYDQISRKFIKHPNFNGNVTQPGICTEHMLFIQAHVSTHNISYFWCGYTINAKPDNMDM